MGVARGCFFYKLNIFQKEGRCHENKEKKVFLSTVYVNTYFLYCSAGTLKQDNTVYYGQYFKIDNSELVKSRNCKTHARGMLTISVFSSSRVFCCSPCLSNVTHYTNKPNEEILV